MKTQWYLIQILLAAVLTGVAVGGTGALFLSVLERADTARIALIQMAEASQVPGWLAGMLAGAATVTFAAWLARRYAPNAPQSVVEGNEPDKAFVPPPLPSSLATIAVNFAGTVAAAGAGLALGPERPAIQFSGAIGRLTSRLLRLNRSDLELMLAAAGGAGVATMFNAPLACAAYTVETVLRRVDLRISLIVLGVGIIAVGVARALLGREVNFAVGTLPPVPFQDLILFLLLGCGVGALGWVHGHLIKATKGAMARLRVDGMARAAVIGATAGWLAWQMPGLAGVGDALTQQVIDGSFAFQALALFFLVRFLLGPLSLAAGTPGGYFTPVLLLGALAGAMYSALIESWLSSSHIAPAAFVVAGMAVALAAVAQAPFTGVLLVIETTGIESMALPMVVAVFGAIGVTHLLNSPIMSHGLESALRHMPHRTRLITIDASSTGEDERFSTGRMSETGRFSK